MNKSAKFPMFCAVAKSSKYIPPIPSDPAAIPTKRNITSRGTCAVLASLIEHRLKNNKIPQIKILYSIVPKSTPLIFFPSPSA